MPIRLAIDARLLGQKRPIITDWGMTLPLDLTGQAVRLPLRDITTQGVLAAPAACPAAQAEPRRERMPWPATRGVDLFYLRPPFTGLMAWALFVARLAPLALVGMAVCVAGVALVNWRPGPAPIVKAG